MKEKSLESVICLYALVANFKAGVGYSLMSNIVEMYLSSIFSKQTTETHLDQFLLKIQEYDGKRKSLKEDWSNFFMSELDAQSYILSRELEMTDRLLVLIYLIEFIPFLQNKTSQNQASQSDIDIYNLLNKVGNNLNIAPDDFSDCLSFVESNYEKLSENNNVFVLTDNPTLTIPGVRVRSMPKLDGQLIFIKLRSLNTILFKVSGEAHFEMNSKQVFKRRTYLFTSGSVIMVNDLVPVYYNDVIKSLTRRQWVNDLKLVVDNVEYRFPNGHIGIHPLSFSLSNGEMLAVMGGSGTGKTTLMNLMIGFAQPFRGTIKLNGVDVSNQPRMIRDYIGYVPQEDALLEHLSVYDNLYYTARLSNGKVSENETDANVISILKELNLYEVKNLRVGSPVDKIISGGQRKRLNIGLELIRNPGILFLDEPTSGLSSSDSEKVMGLLKDLTLQGRMVIVNIHQPSSDIFKLFDKLLLMDEGGRCAYYGASMHVNSFLKRSLRLVDSHMSECQLCGNLNTEDIFHLMQMHKIGQDGKMRPERLISPDRWHRQFTRIHHASANDSDQPTPPLQSLGIKRANVFNQFRYFFIRNVKTKIADRQTILMSLIMPPVLGLLLSFFSMHISPKLGMYQYRENQNIPAFIFMSVIVAIFIGMMASSQEIIKDRMILRREAFLSLNFRSYVFAKLLYLILLSGIQMAMYVWVTAYVLEIPNFGNINFEVMWITAVCANCMGLFLSSIFKSISAVYIAIPFVIIPQLLLAGAVIRYDYIHPLFTKNQQVPWIAQVMVSRWTYEAMSVNIFKNNPYREQFYEIDQQMSDASYLQNLLLPEIEDHFFGSNQTSDYYLTPDSAKYSLIVSGLNDLKMYGYSVPIDLSIPKIEGSAMLETIEKIQSEVSVKYDSLIAVKDAMVLSLDPEKYNELRQRYSNKKLSDFVTNSDNVNNIYVENNRFVRKYRPIYYQSQQNWGGTHYFSPEKRIGSMPVATPVYNIFIILLQSAFWIVILFFRPVK
jgi:ABC-type multidrug transport system ATPase subunit